MTHRTARVLELATAAACAALALAKALGPASPEAAHAAAATAVAAKAVAATVGVVEATLAAWLVDGRRPRLAASTVAAFGVALAVASAFAAPPGADAGGCGCLGPVHADQARRLVVAGALVVLAGLRLGVEEATEMRPAAAGASNPHA
jgi:hypothetical protein